MKTNQKVPEGWSVKKLGDVCYLIAGNAFDSNDFVQEGIPLIRISNIDEDKIVLNENTVFLKESFLKENEKFKVQYNDLLIAMSGATTGKMGINTFLEPMLLNQRVCIIRAKNISQNYLNQYLFTHKKDILKQSYGGAQPNIGNNDIKKIKLLLPPLCEQEKIAEILGTWDLAIEKLTALIEQKKLLKKGLMQRLLTGKQRLPGFSEPWKKVKSGECFSFLKTSSYSRAETTDCGEVHYIHYGDIHTKYPLHIFPKDINIYISTKQASKSDCLKTGDLILLDASEDYEGTTKCVELLNISDDEKVVSGLHTLALRDSTQNFINGFRAYITSIPFVKNNFWKQVTGIKVYGVSKDNLKKIKIPIPSLSEQKAIADILSKADEEIDLLTAKLSALKSQKKGLMQKLLTGQIRVKVA